MRIIKQINNNAALALDGNGNELIVLGRGVGFPKIPYELTDLSRIEKAFYGVDSQYLSLAATLPQPILIASANIAEQAELELDCELNSNLPFTLADHLNFAIERFKKGMDVRSPLAYDVKHLYPRETELGYRALDMLEKQTGIRLPECEAVNVALHLINAESENRDIHSMMTALKIISDVDDIIEKKLEIKLNKESFSYSRFTMHLRYLIQRLASGKQMETGSGEMLRHLSREYPQIYLCAREIAAYFKNTWNWQCNKEELLYLMLHINRVQEKNQG